MVLSSEGFLGLGGSRGWSEAQFSPTDVDRLFCRRRLEGENPGVAGLLAELKDSVSSSRDGIDSVDKDRRDD